VKPRFLAAVNTLAKAKINSVVSVMKNLGVKLILIIWHKHLSKILVFISITFAVFHRSQVHKMVTCLRKVVVRKIGIFAVILGWILCYSYDKAMFEFAQSVNSWRVANKFVKKTNYAKDIYNLNRSSLGFVELFFLFF